MTSAATTLTPPRASATASSKSRVPPRAIAPSPTPSSTTAVRSQARNVRSLARWVRMRASSNSSRPASGSCSGSGVTSVTPRPPATGEVAEGEADPVLDGGVCGRLALRHRFQRLRLAVAQPHQRRHHLRRVAGEGYRRLGRQLIPQLQYDPARPPLAGARRPRQRRRGAGGGGGGGVGGGGGGGGGPRRPGGGG